MPAGSAALLESPLPVSPAAPHQAVPLLAAGGGVRRRVRACGRVFEHVECMDVTDACVMRDA